MAVWGVKIGRCFLSMRSQWSRLFKCNSAEVMLLFIGPRSVWNIVRNPEGPTYSISQSYYMRERGQGRDTDKSKMKVCLQGNFVSRKATLAKCYTNHFMSILCLQLNLFLIIKTPKCTWFYNAERVSPLSGLFSAFKLIAQTYVARLTCTCAFQLQKTWPLICALISFLVKCDQLAATCTACGP